MTGATLTGQCLCGEVRFSAKGERRRVSACYCRMCRVHNGGGAFHGVELSGALNIKPTPAIKWYASSDRARRGFCSHCGSTLFWQANEDPSVFDISLGALDDNSSFKIDTHIFADDRAPYQIIPSGARQMTRAQTMAEN